MTFQLARGPEMAKIKAGQSVNAYDGHSINQVFASVGGGAFRPMRRQRPLCILPCLLLRPLVPHFSFLNASSPVARHDIIGVDIGDLILWNIYQIVGCMNHPWFLTVIISKGLWQ